MIIWLHTYKDYVSLIPAEAGTHKQYSWIPHQVRNVR